MTTKDTETAIYKHVCDTYLDDRSKLLIQWAHTDLWHGPLSPAEVKETEGFDYPGFERACDEIKDALSEVGEMWCDDICECAQEDEPNWVCECGECKACESDDGPEGDHPEDWTRLDRSEVLKIVCGKELAPYVR